MRWCVPSICTKSASQWHSQYAILFTPLTICRCLLLFRRSYTGNTTTLEVNTAAPITTNSEVMNVESLGSFAMSPSASAATTGNHSTLELMEYESSPVLCRKIAVFALWLVAKSEWCAVW
jgi:hypothetical protein|tara:strand:+ start:3066 stop:3425 length:360 start_codon:yes stop_codon:yes gene_type:complete